MLYEVITVIDDLSLRESGSVDVRGDINLNNIRSPLRLSGDIRAGDATPFWNHAHYDLELRVSDQAVQAPSGQPFADMGSLLDNPALRPGSAEQ